jgi:hypothetical protein
VFLGPALWKGERIRTAQEMVSYYEFSERAQGDPTGALELGWPLISSSPEKRLVLQTLVLISH